MDVSEYFALFFLILNVLSTVGVDGARCSAVCPPSANTLQMARCTATVRRSRVRRRCVRFRRGQCRRWGGTYTAFFTATEQRCCSGFTKRGTRCIKLIDECQQSSPCQHSGTCQDREVGYTCTCVEGYSGDNCQNIVSTAAAGEVTSPTSANAETTAAPDPVGTVDCRDAGHTCVYGTCTEAGGSWSCNCQSGYSGSRCQDLVNGDLWYKGNIKCGFSKYSDVARQPLNTPLVVGGLNARQNEYPYQALLTRQTRNGHSFYCGAVILNHWWLATAAHCLVGLEGVQKRAWVGMHRLRQTDSTQSSHPITTVKVHPAYVDHRFDNDIGLVRVSNPIMFSQNVMPACPPMEDETYAHRKAVISGWGANEFDPESAPAQNILQYATMNITTNAFCESKLQQARRYYGIQTEIHITDDMICATDNAGSWERATCQGDSGGPLAVMEEASKQFRVVGLTSWGVGCNHGVPSVYARVTDFMTWINNNIPAADRTPV